MPVLPVNTVQKIGIVLAYYWGGILWQYWWNSEVGVSLTVGTLLVYYGRSTSTRNTTAVLAWYRASSKFPPGYFQYLFCKLYLPNIKKHKEKIYLNFEYLNWNNNFIKKLFTGPNVLHINKSNFEIIHCNVMVPMVETK